MLVVLPVCHKDNHLALKSLELAIKLDGKTEFQCLIAHDFTHNPGALLDLANSYFSKVSVFKYDPPQNLSWPQAPNHVWQSVARYVKKEFGLPWFWWEPDVTPLKKDWLSILFEEYKKYGKPFMGHILPGMGHMNGVAIYPSDIPSYSVKAMLCEMSPFDMILWDDIKNHVHKANHLMAHYPRFTGVKLTVKEKRIPLKMADDGYVVFHGCNDGSMASLMLDQNFVWEENGSVEREFTDADINSVVDESEPFWQKQATYLKTKGIKVIPYNECIKKIPSIKKQGNCGFFSLPKTIFHVHFNSGICSDGKDLFLITRQWTTPNQVKWQSYLYIWKLDKDLVPHSPFKLNLPEDNGNEQFEDPRIVFHNGSFWVSYCVWQHGAPYRAKQRMTQLDGSFRNITTIHLPYGKNDYRLNSGTGSEKNWVWFNHNSKWHFVYQATPHIVVEVHNSNSVTEHKTYKIPDWRYGEIRGGTPPVRVGDEYITFFHSSLPWKRRQNRYYMGAYTFSAIAPFEIKRFTRHPILAGSEEDPRELGGPLCVFPCGAILRDDEWLITGGSNDEDTFWMKLKHKDLKLEPV